MGTTVIYYDLNIISSAKTVFPDSTTPRSTEGSGSDIFWEGSSPTHDGLVDGEMGVFGEGMWFQWGCG